MAMMEEKRLSLSDSRGTTAVGFTDRVGDICEGGGWSRLLGAGPSMSESGKWDMADGETLGGGDDGGVLDKIL